MYMNFLKKRHYYTEKKMYAKVLISYSHLLLAKPKARSGVNLIELLQVYFTSIAIALKL